MYTVIVEFENDPKTYEFYSIDDALEVYRHAIDNGLMAYIIDEFGDILHIR